jgi:hypothetical protein
MAFIVVHDLKRDCTRSKARQLAEGNRSQLGVHEMMPVRGRTHTNKDVFLKLFYMGSHVRKIQRHIKSHVIKVMWCMYYVCIINIYTYNSSFTHITVYSIKIITSYMFRCVRSSAGLYILSSGAELVYNSNLNFLT